MLNDAERAKLDTMRGDTGASR